MPGGLYVLLALIMAAIGKAIIFSAVIYLFFISSQ